jgi:outer membrane protein insertion porin family
VIVGASGQVGHVSGLGEKVTQSKRFHLGGRTIRGFDASGIGPRDAGSGDSVGGNTMYSGRVEVLSNIGVNKDTGVRWTIFSDFGSLWNTDYPTNVTEPDANDVRASLGLGIYWATAIGPLSFSWANAINKMDHDRTKTFQFNIGTRL